MKRVDKKRVGKNYHVCEVLKHLTRETYCCIASGILEQEKNQKIFQSIGAILNKILVINQLMLNQLTTHIQKVEDVNVRCSNYRQGINFYIREKYDFDVDEVWKATEEIIEQGYSDNLELLLIKDVKSYIMKLLEGNRNDIILTTHYLHIYNLLELSVPSPVFGNRDRMIELALNGLYLGKIMEMELEELGNFEINRNFLKFLVGERRPKFFMSVINTCREKEKRAEETLVI